MFWKSKSKFLKLYFSFCLFSLGGGKESLGGEGQLPPPQSTPLSVGFCFKIMTLIHNGWDIRFIKRDGSDGLVRLGQIRNYQGLLAYTFRRTSHASLARNEVSLFDFRLNQILHWIAANNWRHEFIQGEILLFEEEKISLARSCTIWKCKLMRFLFFFLK